MSIRLLPHQRIARDWLLKTGRGILADEPGLGKTYPAISAALSYRGPVMFIVPAYLTYNWQLAITEMCPGIQLAWTRGTHAERVNEIYRVLGHGARALLTTYEHLRIHSRELQSIRWSCIVFDEAHMLRGRGGKRTEADGQITRLTYSQQAEAAFRLSYTGLFLLTGTPQKKNAGDYWALLRMIDGSRFTSYWQFVNRYAQIVHTPWGDHVGITKDRIGLRDVLRPYLLRRTYKGVGIKMPEVVHQEVYIRADPKFISKYRETRKNYRIEDVDAPEGFRYLLNASQVMSELYQLVSAYKPKIAALNGILADHNEEQVIIWTWRRDTADLLAANVGGRRPVFVAHGGRKAGDRKRDIEAWKRTKNGILIATIAALSLGENLQTCSFMVFYEKSYIPGDNEQATARMRRLGQKRPTKAVTLMVRGTVDTTVQRVQKKREVDFEGLLLHELWRDDDDSDNSIT